MGGASDEIRATTIRGRWGGLRPLDAGRDAARLHPLFHDVQVAESWREMKVGPFDDAVDFRAHVDDLVADRRRAFFAIVRDDDAALGWLCLMEAHGAHRSVELGYVMFAPELRRTTLATEALYLAMDHAFTDLGFQRLEWTCTAENEASRRAADRLGFTFEGVMRRKAILKGMPRDIPMYSLLADEWAVRRQAFVDWLDPANFVNSVQRRPLAKPGSATA